jgi:hypothetical protein
VKARGQRGTDIDTHIVYAEGTELMCAGTVDIREKLFLVFISAVVATPFSTRVSKLVHMIQPDHNISTNP